ncbi:hypothetical protein J1N35_006350 [Gossypium stocksii]|uniref:Uncharacterized protein n=1 Tax=Gossypium stocksii TaxID=47602 RepID=A0A9D3WH22_9ROSI|nr:hypothetical protein J1N35_006350 [Gossypium stocksii]
MKTVKLGPMRLNSSKALQLVESSTRLPPMGEVDGASDFKGKEVIHVGQLTRVNATSMTVRGSFGPQELAQFKELLEKPVRLKPGLPDNEDMKT